MKIITLVVFWGALIPGGLLSVRANQAAIPDGIFRFQRGYAGSVVKYDFELKNAGPGTWTVEGVKSSCACTTIVASPKTIASGKSGIISVETHLDQPGRKSVQIMVATAQAGNHLFQIEGEVLERKAGLFVEPKELLAKKDEKITFIDVRSPVQFDSSHVANSTNAPLFALHARAYLKKENLVLVGSGWDDAALIPETEASLRAGFVSVRILRGGFRQWVQDRGKQVGVFSGKPQLEVISAADFQRSSDSSSWALIASKSSQKLPPINGLQAKVFFYAGNVDAGEAINKILLDNPGISRVALLSTSPQQTQSLRRLNLQASRPVFLMEQSWQGLQQLYQESRVEAPRTTIVSSNGTGKPRDCPTCPSTP